MVDGEVWHSDEMIATTQLRHRNSRLSVLVLADKKPAENEVGQLKSRNIHFIGLSIGQEALIDKVLSLIYQNASYVVSATCEAPLVEIGSFTFDQAQQQLTIQDETRELTQREALLLEYLQSRRNEVVRRESILKAIWGEDNYFAGRSLDVFISRLRKYLQQDSSILIENIHGVGFRFAVSD
uniref:Winged helix-turn-helix domain-containing protein n=1 Tax=Roseihalotalea indica TaxID=2867963 RepID=A0AA49GTC6_9BACT|nr:winged helix-turn-helix domain-containing protein [Tunicatimonas sp. TK19036]